MWKLKAGKKGEQEHCTLYGFIIMLELIHQKILFSSDYPFLAWLKFSTLLALLNDSYLTSIAKVMHLRTFWIEAKMWPRNEEYCLWVKAQVKKSTDTTAGRVFLFLVLKIDLARHNSGTLVRKIDCRLLISVSSRRTQSLRKIGPRTTLLLCTILF